MKIDYLARPIAAAALFVCASTAEAGVLVPIPPVPGSTATDVYDINDSNVIVGDYTTSDGTVHGFIGTLDGNYSAVDYPDSIETELRGVSSDGYATGFSLNADTGFYGPAFVRTPAGRLVNIKRQKSTMPGSTQGVIAHGNLVGEEAVLDENYNLFYYGFYAKAGKYKADLSLPFDTNETRPRGLNTAGVVAGYFRDLDNGSRYRGFMLDEGVATIVDYPDDNAYTVYLEDINEQGLVSGSWTDQNFTVEHGFLFDPTRDRFKQIDVPNAATTFVDGINDFGVVAVSADGAPYLYCPKKKTCPIHNPHEIEVPDVWIPAHSRRVACRNGCIGEGQPHVKRADALAVHEAIARDPELQRELRLPFRP